MLQGRDAQIHKTNISGYADRNSLATLYKVCLSVCLSLSFSLRLSLSLSVSRSLLHFNVSYLRHTHNNDINGVFFSPFFFFVLNSKQ